MKKKKATQEKFKEDIRIIIVWSNSVNLHSVKNLNNPRVIKLNLRSRKLNLLGLSILVSFIKRNQKNKGAKTRYKTKVTANPPHLSYGIKAFFVCSSRPFCSFFDSVCSFFKL